MIKNKLEHPQQYQAGNNLSRTKLKISTTSKLSQRSRKHALNRETVNAPPYLEESTKMASSKHARDQRPHLNRPLKGEKASHINVSSQPPRPDNQDVLTAATASRVKTSSQRPHKPATRRKQPRTKEEQRGKNEKG